MHRNHIVVLHAEVAYEGVLACARTCLKSPFQLHVSVNFVYMSGAGQLLKCACEGRLIH